MLLLLLLLLFLCPCDHAFAAPRLVLSKVETDTEGHARGDGADELAVHHGRGYVRSPKLNQRVNANLQNRVCELVAGAACERRPQQHPQMKKGNYRASVHAPLS